MRMPVMLGLAAALAAGMPAARGAEELALVNLNRQSHLDALIAEGSYNDALAWIDEAERKGRLPPELQLKRGIVLMQLGDTDEARKVFERLRDAYPGQPAPYVNLAALHARADELEQAREDLSKARDLAPRQAATHESLGRVHLGLAWKSFRLAAELDPGREALTRKNQLIESLIRDAAPSSPGSMLASAPVTARPVARDEPAPAGARSVGTGRDMLPGALAVAGASQARLVPAPAPALTDNPRPVPVPSDLGDAAAAPACPAQDEAPCREALQALEAWRSDWSQRALARYLAHYRRGYVPTGFNSAAQWQAYKRRVFAAAGHIAVDLRITELQWQAPHRLRVSAVQRYQSSSYRDQTRKLFVLVEEAGRWRIASEQQDAS